MSLLDVSIELEVGSVRDKQDAVGENHQKGETTADDAESWEVKTGFFNFF